MLDGSLGFKEDQKSKHTRDSTSWHEDPMVFELCGSIKSGDKQENLVHVHRACLRCPNPSQSSPGKLVTFLAYLKGQSIQGEDAKLS